MDLNVLVIGGGLQGTHISLALTRRAGVERDALRVLDPWPEPLARWNETTRNTGMQWLRSSIVQNIDLEALSIPHFARTKLGTAASQAFYGRYRRPGHAIFQEHTRHVIESNGLAELRIAGRASSVRRSNGSLIVETDSGSISAKNVILALGNTENLYAPEWAEALVAGGAKLQHIFAPGFDEAALFVPQRYSIVGGGSSAIQLAMLLAQRFPGMVDVLSHHPMKVADFDFDAPWHGPRGRRQLEEVPDPASRRTLIERSKFGGTIPSDLQLELDDALAQGKLRLLVGNFGAPELLSGGRLSFSVEAEDGSEHSSTADHTVIATGFARGCPQRAMIEAIAEDMGLPLAPCGYPLPQRDLSWGPGLFVMGPHAELEIGPISRNMGGARRAAERILEAFGSAD